MLKVLIKVIVQLFLLKFKNKTIGFAENYYDYLNGLIINNKSRVLQKY